MPTRAEVIVQARLYIDTPFIHQARVMGKKGGIDCVGLVLCVADDLGVADINGRPFKRFDYKDYSAQPVGKFVHEEMRRRMAIKPLRDLQAGDIVTMKIPTDPCHAAIITEQDGVLHVVHAYQGYEKCREHILNHQWRNRIVGVFSFPQVSE